MMHHLKLWHITVLCQGNVQLHPGDFFDLTTLLGRNFFYVILYKL